MNTLLFLCQLLASSLGIFPRAARELRCALDALSGRKPTVSTKRPLSGHGWPLPMVWFDRVARCALGIGPPGGMVSELAPARVRSNCEAPRHRADQALRERNGGRPSRREVRRGAW